MKKDKGFKWKLGMFVTIGIVLIIGAFYVIGRQSNLFGKTFHVMTVFNNVGGLTVGNNVQFSGINVGTVKNIVLITDTSVMVDMVIEEDVRKFIKKDAIATIGSEGLMGNKIITILPGRDGELLQPNGYINSRPPLNTDEIIESLQATAENAEIITDQLAEIAFKINNGDGAINKLLTDTAFARNLSGTMENLESSSMGLNENLEAAKSSFLLRGYFKRKAREREERNEVTKKSREEKRKNKDGK